MRLSPIVLFAFSRPDHTRHTLEALAANDLAISSELFVFVDGPRDERDERSVNEVRRLAESVDGFAKVEVIQRLENYGLARNIIEGVSEVIGRYNRVIVLEDDILTSPYFLNFMNRALERYAHEPRAWHISGWNYPIDPENMPEAFFWRAMNCWGWATWGDRWEYFNKDPGRLIQTWSRADIKRFNLDGAHNFWSQVVANKEKRLNTWAIFWYATIFEQNGLCLNPTISFAYNSGHDGSGVNCGTSDPYKDMKLAENGVANFPPVIGENKQAVERIKKLFYEQRGNLLYRVAKRFRKLFLRIFS